MQLYSSGPTTAANVRRSHEAAEIFSIAAFLRFHLPFLHAPGSEYVHARLSAWSVRQATYDVIESPAWSAIFWPKVLRHFIERKIRYTALAFRN